MNKNSRINIFFSKLFSPVILKNEIVSTVLYVVGVKIAKIKNTIDITLNNDI